MTFLDAQYQALIWVFLASFGVSALILVTKPLHAKYSLDSAEGVQRAHTNPTPRVGGLGIICGLAVGAMLAINSVKPDLRLLLLLGFIVFSFGFTEDITKKVSVAIRLWATFMPAVVGYFVGGMTLRKIGFAPFDQLLLFTPFAICFTAFAIGGITHAMNIIDGFNGLTAWVSIWILTSIAFIAHSVGDSSVFFACAVVIVSILGLLPFNWPSGKLFLGDGGSYLIGLCIAWCSVLITMRNPEVSPFAPLLACAYPVIEVLYSIYRRKKNRQESGQPDRLHLHQLMATQLVYNRFSKLRSVYKNSLSGFLISLFTILPAYLSWYFYTQTDKLLMCFGLFIIAYVCVYQLCAAFPHASPLGKKRKGA